MEIHFATQRLQKLCNDARRMRAEWGAVGAKRLQRRLAEFHAADSLEDLRKLPQARCHELTGDRKGLLAVDLEHPLRLVFQPDHETLPVRPDGGLDWARVTRILILEIVDYH